jgi:hypothetical protein
MSRQTNRSKRRSFKQRVSQSTRREVVENVYQNVSRIIRMAQTIVTVKRRVPRVKLPLGALLELPGPQVKGVLSLRGEQPGRSPDNPRTLAHPARVMVLTAAASRRLLEV